MATRTRTTFNPDGTVVSQTTVTIADEDANADTLRDRAATALTANAAFLAITSPTNAQVLAQTRVLTRENTALIRLVLGLLDSTDGS